MKILTSDKIREADAYTIKHEPIASIDLMERAAHQLLNWIKARYAPEESFRIFAGPGNNGGDGWALARLLSLEGYKDVRLSLLKISDKLSPDADINRRRLEDETHVEITAITEKSEFPEIESRDVVVDALFGSGLSRPLEGLPGELVEHLNSSPCKAVIAVDVPSGLFSEGVKSPTAGAVIEADHTLSFQFPKLAFMFPENDRYAGKWEVLPIGLYPEFIQKVDTPYYFTREEDVYPLLKPRKKFSHKGTYGHALLVAGSYGMMGAAVLAARAAVRAGTGLLTSHVPRLGVDIMQNSVPESLITMDESDIIFTEHTPLDKFTAVAIGPGLNQKSNTKKGLIALLKAVRVPLLIDADGLNLLSSIENWPELLPENTILTPHPKEFDRLFGESADTKERLEKVQAFSKSHPCVIVLKGAHTAVSDPRGNIHFNSTGNPGMAKGGCGDVLTGIILGLLAQGYSPADAARLGVFVHGSAGDLGALDTGLTALLPSDLTDNIGKAFNVLEKRI